MDLMEVEIMFLLPLNYLLDTNYTFKFTKPVTTLVLTFSINHQSSNAFISTNKQAMNANHRCKLKRNSLAFQWDRNRYDRSYELRVIPDLVGAVHGIRKWSL